jgi:putative oxidoreductase
MKNIFQNIEMFLSKFQDFALLILRLVLAYGFLIPAINKLQGFNAVVAWFDQSLHIPFPWLNAVLATGTEVTGVIFLSLGLFTRLISIPLSVIMIVAIITVHGFSQFAAAENGFEIPLYYLVMLFVLIGTGAGKYSLDEVFSKKYF